MKETLEMLKTVEEHCLGDKKFFGGNTIGLADLAFGAIAHWLPVLEEAAGLKFIEARKFPRWHAWAKRFKEVPAIKENLPVPEEMVVNFKRRREMILASA